MCYGPCILYSNCGHRKFTIESACAHGRNPTGECSKGLFGATRFRTSSMPSLCPNCYRRKVDDIIARYRREIRLLDEEILALTQVINMNYAPATVDLVEARSELEEQRGDLIDERYAKLEEFRLQQGVWGDGGIWEGYKPFGTLSAVG
ncbi:MAG: hypothetical protein Q9206_003421 [Seirophora lacunosa]